MARRPPGIIAANSNDGVWTAGIDWAAKILPVRVLGKCFGDDSDIIDGIAWAAGLSVPGVPANPTPAQVINLSIGEAGECAPAYQQADRVRAGARGHAGDRRVSGQRWRRTSPTIRRPTVRA